MAADGRTKVRVIKAWVYWVLGIKSPSGANSRDYRRLFKRGGWVVVTPDFGLVAPLDEEEPCTPACQLCAYGRTLSLSPSVTGPQTGTQDVPGDVWPSHMNPNHPCQLSCCTAGGERPC